MRENSASNDIENDEYNPDIEESDYKTLITRLKKIKTTMDLLVKTIFK